MVWGIIRSMGGRGRKEYVNVKLAGMVCANFLEAARHWLHQRVSNATQQKGERTKAMPLTAILSFGIIVNV